ncbi:hypothetical protein [Xanthomonas sp. 3058]|uniref:hypothetical protein n=1 Tax=Xanthomonas sp. 3058 TaxID=3035314 RepID=UPI0016104347|nr:hypothetical protein [Xanthomonas sp. 3058]MBB5863111.1 hypothetical protein [Xanthomonas sp. 3058]
MTLLAPTPDASGAALQAAAREAAALEAAALAAARAERIAQSEAARPALRSVRMPAALERLERAARAEVQAMIHPRRSCSEEALLFATVAWDLGLDGDTFSIAGR